MSYTYFRPSVRLKNVKTVEVCRVAYQELWEEYKNVLKDIASIAWECKYKSLGLSKKVSLLEKEMQVLSKYAIGTFEDPWIPSRQKPMNGKKTRIIKKEKNNG